MCSQIGAGIATCYMCKESTAVMNICIALPFLIFVELCDSSSHKPYDERCRIIPNASLRKCPHQRWFFNWKNKVCLPSCSGTAPFSSKIECQGECRSGDVCDFPVASAHCFDEVFPVYVYSPKDESCFLTYDCTYFLNKFPTLGECQRTCIKPQEHAKSSAVRSTHASGQPSYFNILPGQQGHTASKIPFLKIQMRPTPPTTDNQCRMNVATTSLNECRHKRWYYNENKRVCESTCSEEAPFLNKLACDGVCRTVEVCDFPMASYPCFGEVNSIFIYNPNDKSCFKSYSCSFFGNKFPTLDECRRTCKKCATKDRLGCPTASSSQENDQIHNLSTSAGNQSHPSHSGSSTRAALANDRCRITCNTTISTCSPQRWYLDRATKQCLQSCDPAAPFSTKIECEATCRNGEVCDYPMAGAFCFGEVFPVYFFNPSKKKCFLTYDCSYFGNKFRTLGECQRTCEKPNGGAPYPGQTDNTIFQSVSQSNESAGSASGTIQTATGTGSPLQQGLTDNLIRQVSSQSTTSGSSGHPAQQTATGTGSLLLPGQPGNTIQQVTSQSSTATVGSGLAVHAAETAHGSTIPAMSSSQVSGQTNNLSASLTDQVPLPPSRNPAILQQMPSEQQDVTYTTGSSQQACTPPCNFNVPFVQQGALRPNLTAVKIQARPKRPMYDRRCKVIATLPTYKCGQRWFFDKRTGACFPSCSRRAPFRSKIACNGVCRSVEACNFLMGSIGCFREVHEVFIYDPNQNSCLKAYDCSYFGNKFPTLQQCQTTCRKGGAQQQMGNGAVSISEISGKPTNSDTTVSHQAGQSLSGMSTGSGLERHQPGTGAADQQVSTVLGNSTNTSGHISVSVSNANNQTPQSSSGQSTATSPSVHRQATAKLSTSSLLPSTHGSGNTGTQSIQQHGQSAPDLLTHLTALGAAQQQIANVMASSAQASGSAHHSGSNAGDQPAPSLSATSTGTESPKPVAVPVQTITIHSGSQDPKEPAGPAYGISSEDKATVDVKSIKK